MEKIIFKAIFAIIGIALVYVLFRIESKMGVQRFASNDVFTLDTKTGITYYYKPDEGYSRLGFDGKLVRVKSLPKD